MLQAAAHIGFHLHKTAGGLWLVMVKADMSRAEFVVNEIH